MLVNSHSTTGPVPPAKVPHKHLAPWPFRTFNVEDGPPGFRPPKGIAKKLNMAKLSDFRALARKLLRENNIAFNCLQHLRRSDYAMIWEGNYYDPDKDVHDYAQLTDGTIAALVCKIANIFEQLLTKNSTIALYLPPSIQLPLCLLAAAKIGHAPLIIDPLTTNDFVPALKEMNVSAIITLDAFWHGDKLIESKKILDEAIGKLDAIKSVIVINHTASSKAIPKRSEEIVGRRPNSSIEISHLIVSSPLPPLLAPIPHSVISVRSPKDVRFSIRHLFPNAKFEPFDMPK
ncbi:hypothetical protein WR25_14071 [Diploscapter pachys]|uniref:acetate--CoA ligase n=1 Tax=Diploscapter pachys TaxID=2018661 RepID=A0A2A2J5X7_9BILA|nr:hypothetical protein WR25_14071 [Diploscapter pachys]